MIFLNSSSSPSPISFRRRKTNCRNLMPENAMGSVLHDSVETVNAAATAIVRAESRVQQPVQKRRWARSCLNIYSCFGTHKQTKKISHAVLLPEPPVPPISDNRTLSSSPSITVPFRAPPSSPVSFLQSDPPSATYSPGGLLPDGPASIFAIGPYAHETQLVSPPVFSTFTTEPSTANFTPPPESVQITTPSSPEVPFAQLLAKNSGSHSKFPLSQYEFQPYGIPPCSEKRKALEFRMGEAPKVLGYENFKWESRAESGSLTPNECSNVDNIDCKSGNGDSIDQRVSFELFGEEIPTCVVRAPSLRYEITGDGLNKKGDGFKEHCNEEESHPHHKHRTISLGSSKDFNFNNAAKGDSVKELSPRNTWSFFPMLQSGAG